MNQLENHVPFSTAEQAFHYLKTKSKIFSIGGIGVADSPSKASQAIDFLIKQPHAKEWMIRLVKEGENEVSQLYGLFGLHDLHVSDEEFATWAAPLLQKNPEISTAAGCLVGIKRTVEKIVSDWGRNAPFSVSITAVLKNGQIEGTFTFINHSKNVIGITSKTSPGDTVWREDFHLKEINMGGKEFLYQANTKKGAFSVFVFSLQPDEKKTFPFQLDQKFDLLPGSHHYELQYRAYHTWNQNKEQQQAYVHSSWVPITLTGKK